MLNTHVTIALKKTEKRLLIPFILGGKTCKQAQNI